jgi:hypothetical protein
MTLDELSEPLTAAELEEQLYTAVSAQGISTTTWKPGAVTRVIISALAIVLAALSLLIAFLARSGFLELATGDWLDLVAQQVYGTTRIQETFATGVVTLTNDTGVGSFVDVQPGDLIVRNGAGKTYRNTEVFTLPATPLATVDVDVQAEEAGSASSSGPATITSFVTPFIGCSVTNATDLVGSDRETDATLRARARAKTGSLSPNGPKDAYFYIATSQKRGNGTAIEVTRARFIPDGFGGIDIYLADKDGSIAGTVGDPNSDLGIVNSAIQEYATPLGVTARPASATPQAIAVTYEIWVESAVGFSEAELEDNVLDALKAYLGSVAVGGERLPLIAGGWVYRSALIAAIAGAAKSSSDAAAVGEHFVRVDLLAPAADVSIGTSSAPTLGTLTPTVHLVPSSGGV